MQVNIGKNVLLVILIIQCVMKIPASTQLPYNGYQNINYNWLKIITMHYNILLIMFTLNFFLIYN